VRTTIRSFTRWRDPTQDRCVNKDRLHLCLYEQGKSSRSKQRATIWDLLEGSKLAEGHEKDVCINEDQGELRQDRYALRTAPQFLGPQIEDIISALNTVTIECNSSEYHLLSALSPTYLDLRIATDNPLFNGETGEVHNGGNFQAMAVTNAMEKTRLALHHIGKLLFAQATELMNPSMNRGLPPSLAASDPSLNYHAKGLDVAAAAYISELGFLANPRFDAHPVSGDAQPSGQVSSRKHPAYDIDQMTRIQFISADLRAGHDHVNRSSVYAGVDIPLLALPR